MMLSVVASAILAANQVAGLVSAELCGGVEGSLVCMFFCLPHLHATTWNCTQTNIPLMARPFLLIRTCHRFNIGGTRMAAITEGCAVIFTDKDGTIFYRTTYLAEKMRLFVS